MNFASLMLALLQPFARNLTRPIVAEVKIQVHRVLLAVALAATGVACIIVGLTYFASSLWHTMLPLIGSIGSDLLLGGLYVGLAVLLLLGGFRMVR